MISNDSIWVKALEIQSDSLQACVDSLQAKLDALQYKTEFLSNIVETTNDGVNNQLASATLWLEVIAIIIALGGVVLSIHISYKKRQIENIATTVEEKKLEIERMACETERLDAKILHNLSDLYKDLRKEETNALLDRLVFEPYDICNISDLLLARELDEDSYPKLKEAYLKLLREFEAEKPEHIDETYRIRFMILFYQHFCFQSINDADIASDFIEHFPAGCKTAFKRDIRKSTVELCRALSDEKSSFNKEEVLVSYLKALNNSQHKEYTELKNIFEQNIVPQTLLHSAIERCNADKVYLLLFGINPPEGGDAS